MSSVTVPRSVLVGLVAVLLVCLGITAFLAGRASAPTVAPGTASAPAAPGSTPGAVAEPYARTLPAPVPLPDAGPVTAPPAAQAPAAPAGVVPSLAPATPGDGARVARYFQEMETAQASAKYWDDPQALAGSLVQGLAKGDRSGIDELLAATRGAHSRMQAIDVPADCAEHHRRSLDLVAQAASMLDAIAGGMTSGDVEGLGAFPAKARQLEADTKDVDALAGRIKQRYGIS